MTKFFSTEWNCGSYEIPVTGHSFYGFTVTDFMTGEESCCEDNSPIINVHRCFGFSELFICQTKQGNVFLVKAICTCLFDDDIRSKYIAYDSNFQMKDGCIMNFKRFDYSQLNEKRDVASIFRSGKISRKKTVIFDLVYELESQNSRYVFIKI